MLHSAADLAHLMTVASLAEAGVPPRPEELRKGRDLQALARDLARAVEAARAASPGNRMIRDLGAEVESFRDGIEQLLADIERRAPPAESKQPRRTQPRA